MITEEQKNYFVTAKHIFNNVIDNTDVEVSILKDAKWSNLNGMLWFHKNPNVDIAIIANPSLDKYHEAIILKEFDSLLSDEIFFLGFPYGRYTPDNSQINLGFPYALVKKGVLSGGTVYNGAIISYVDGHNNPGFSGGPVFIKDRYMNTDGTLEGEQKRWSLFGVVSAYIPQNNKLKTPFGDLDYNENSGIVIVYGRKHINEIIDTH